MISNPTSEKLTFCELIEKHKIEIPIIQRDYAQGRKGKEELRKNFLTALLEGLTNKLELDFVYGSVKDNVLQPLDGQQRLTTLFLLHWYIAIKENKLDDEIKNRLTKFTYETRTSSREFCSDLINKGIVWSNEQKISERIIDSPWFFLSWKKDPTINSMLTMLDAIHQIFQDTTELWEKRDNICFQYIELQNFGLSDDLYIKMNARGKPLTDFENFKAKFEQHITNNEWEKGVDPIQKFSYKIDTVWTDLFWNYRNDKNKIDDSILKFISSMAILLYAQNLEIFDDIKDQESVRKELESKSKSKTITEETIKRERIERRIAKLFNDYSSIKPEDFPSKVALDYLKKCFDIYSKNENDKLYPKLTLWDFGNKDSSLFTESINATNSTTYKQRVLFYSQTSYLNAVETKFNSETFSEWLRVVRNIVENATIDSATTFIGAINLINELSVGCESIFSFLSDNSVQSRFADEQVKEEIRKAKLITTNNEVKEFYFELEDTNFCKGAISWCIECAGEDNGKLKAIKGIVNLHLCQHDVSNLFRRALLTLRDNCFYNYWGSWSFNTDTMKRSLLDNRNDLKNNFTINYLKLLIIQLCDNGNDLQGVVDNYSCPDDMPNWKKRLIKEAELWEKHCQSHYIGIPNAQDFCYLFGTFKRPTKEDCFKLE